MSADTLIIILTNQSGKQYKACMSLVYKFYLILDFSSAQHYSNPLDYSGTLCLSFHFGCHLSKTARISGALNPKNPCMETGT